VIAFGCSVTQEHRWRAWALPSIERASEAGALVIDERGEGSLPARCNRILARAAERDDLEALVLLHEDAEITDPAFAAKVRERLHDGTIAVVGTAGGRGVSGLAWWEGSRLFGRINAPNLLPREPAADIAPDFVAGVHDVDTVDGLLMVLSPWTVRELRFDEALSDFHGYDADLCFQARARGLRVVVDDLAVVHHTYGGIGDREAWIGADIAFRRKWRNGGAALV
jgi:GT2 family glycosyltransferase